MGMGPTKTREHNTSWCFLPLCLFCSFFLRQYSIGVSKVEGHVFKTLSSTHLIAENSVCDIDCINILILYLILLCLSSCMSICAGFVG